MYMGRIAELGIALTDLADDQSNWSQRTFGTNAERGPVGGLKHLMLEAQETIAAWESLPNPGDMRTARVNEEFADCLLLLLDASRRAGISPARLIRAAQEKMKVNKTRTYPKPTSDVPSEHIK